ncbi:hypothetical protein [uncultured Corynebacterium sp.]|uniref:hypothetical protein n=1 Tax=uncultured Corynebacterium sp. TaxID=159447 RepID=UPI0025D86FF5|nr:hypothetical protein [uncultured Corynebacterium sp.]
MTTRNKALLTILIILLLILGTLVALVVFAARGQDADDSPKAKEETAATQEQQEEEKSDDEQADKEDKSEEKDKDDKDEKDKGDKDEGDSSDDPTEVPDEFIGNYEGMIKWPPGADGENTKIGVTFTENSTTLTTGRDSRALRVDVDKKQTNKKRIYSEAPILEHGVKNATWTFIPADDGMDVSYTVQGASRTDAHLTSTD